MNEPVETTTPEPATPETVTIDKAAYDELLKTAETGRLLLSIIGPGHHVLLMRHGGSTHYEDYTPTHENVIDAARALGAAIKALAP